MRRRVANVDSGRESMMNSKLETENERWLCVEGLFTMMVSLSLLLTVFTTPSFTVVRIAN